MSIEKAKDHLKNMMWCIQRQVAATAPGSLL